MPVLLGAGFRLFDDPRFDHIGLERIGVHEVGDRTSLRFLVKK